MAGDATASTSQLLDRHPPGPDLSVIIPVYNTAEYLHECLDSATSAPDVRIEIIAVDDGSTDASAAILAEYANQFSFVQVLHSNRGGAGGARNMGLRVASGHYIAFLDSDDLFAEHALAELYRLALTHDTDIAAGVAERFDRTRRWRHTVFLEHFLRPIACTDVYETPWLLFDIGPGNKLFRTRFLRDHTLLFPSNTAKEDFDFVTRAYCLADRVTLAPFVIQRYRSRDIWSQPAGTERLDNCYFKDIFRVSQGLDAFLTKQDKLSLKPVKDRMTINMTMVRLVRKFASLKSDAEWIDFMVILKNGFVHINARTIYKLPLKYRIFIYALGIIKSPMFYYLLRPVSAAVRSMRRARHPRCRFARHNQQAHFDPLPDRRHDQG